MNCEDAIELMSARLDGEISPADRQRIEAHLAECAQCRAIDEAMHIDDARLVRGFAPMRQSAAAVAERVAGSVAATRLSWRARWLRIIASAAAGFLAAVLLWQPWHHPPTSGVRPNSIAIDSGAASIGRLDLASGPVQVQFPKSDTWQPMITGGQIFAGARLRTGEETRCELAMADGSELRINQNSELLIRSARNVEVAQGQIWSSVAKQPQPFDVAVADATVSAIGTRFDVQRRSDQVVLAVIEGSTRLHTPHADQVVNQGQVLRIVGGHPAPFDVADALDQATRWTDQLLLLKGPQDPELSRRIDDLFAHLGQEKMDLFRANELRRMGDRCVIPLTRYLQSDRSGADGPKRREAARIIADVAQPWCVGYLIELLEDRDGQVRYQAARALLRLTGEDQGRSPEQWRDGQIADLSDAVRAWKQWWHKNKSGFPAIPVSDSSKA